MSNLEPTSRFGKGSQSQSKFNLKEKILHESNHIKKPSSKFFPFASPSSTALESNPTPGKNYMDFQNFELKNIKSPFEEKKHKIKDNYHKLSVHSPVMKDIIIQNFIIKQQEYEKKEM
jgi:hypothetical protein